LKVTIKQPESWKRILDIEIPKDVVDAAFNEKLDDYRKKVALPGFRQGKVPFSLVKSRFGKGVFAETVDFLIQSNFENACKEHSISPISKGSISTLKGEEGTDISFTIETEIEPEIEITDYEKLKIKPSSRKIKDDDVEKTLEDLRERNAQFSDVDRDSKKGDFITIEYTKVFIDGVERKDFKNPTYPFELGKNRLKEFDKELAGRHAGEIVEVSLRFPKDFTESQLSGKEGVFSVKITKVAEKKLPEFNDELLKKLGNFKSIEDLKQQILKDLEAQEKERAKNEAYNKAIDSLIKDNPFDVPPSRIESYIDHLMEEMSRYRRPAEPMPSREEISEKYHGSAIRALKRFRIIDFIATKEKIKPSQEEVDKEITTIAESYNQPFEQIKRLFRQNGTANRIREDLRERKTLDFLIGEYFPHSELKPS
jgi:trigger factor